MKGLTTGCGVVAKRMRLCGCGSEDDGICSCVFQKPHYEWVPPRFDDLTDDLLCEIFLRLPAKSAHRCKSVSKRWLSLISSSSFARSFISHVPATRMLLFKLKRPWPRVGQVYVLPYVHDNSTLPRSFDYIPPLNPDNDNYDRVLTKTNLVATYGGLVLLQATLRDSIDIHYVCNPITKQWVELPVIPTSDSYVGFTCYYLQQPQGEGGQASRIWADVVSYDNLIKHNANYDPNKIDFTVVSIKPVEEARVFVINLLSSADEVGGWNTFEVPFPANWTSIPYKKNNVVFANGKFYWCGQNCIAAYDPFCNPLQCDLIPFPVSPPMDESLFFIALVAFEGSLRLVLKEFMAERLVAWDLLGYGSKGWVKNVDVSYSCDKHDMEFQSFAGGAAKDKIYFVTDCSTLVLYDMKNKSFQQVYQYHPRNLGALQVMHSLEQFISSSWPTPVPLFRCSTHFDHKLDTRVFLYQN